jgi:hypothetical protein
VGRYIRAAFAACLPQDIHYRIGVMRAEVENIVEEIKRSVGLLRRHL